MILRRQSLKTRPPASLTGHRKKRRTLAKQVNWQVVKGRFAFAKPGRRKRLGGAKK